MNIKAKYFFKFRYYWHWQFIVLTCHINFVLTLNLKKHPTMLIRIVRMNFRPDKITDFRVIFDESKHKIRAMAGCQHLELLQDLDQSNVLMTYSYWDSTEALNAYRHSDVFADTWARTKALFADKPLAYSVERLETILPQNG
jgi:quinol monooxygenase YgiN